jgi:hypothetical protein
MHAKSKCSVIKMHVVIGQEGMQQVLAFNPSVLLLKTFLIFNGSKLHEGSVSMLHTNTYKHTIQINNKQNINHIKQKQKQQKTNLLVETIAWT